MKYANKHNVSVGDIVSIPIHAEFMSEQQICLNYEVVLALKCCCKEDEQIVATGEQPLPVLIELLPDLAILK